MISKILIFFISIYQKTLSPQTGVFRFLYHSPLFSLYSSGSPGCRFYPRCSNYAKQTLKENSLPKAFLLSVRRILRCHSGNSGGIDMVPSVDKNEKYQQISTSIN